MKKTAHSPYHGGNRHSARRITDPLCAHNALYNRVRTEHQLCRQHHAVDASQPELSMLAVAALQSERLIQPDCPMEGVWVGVTHGNAKRELAIRNLKLSRTLSQLRGQSC